MPIPTIEEALGTRPGDWIEWSGGGRPVDLKQKVDYRRRATGDSTFTDTADQLDWHHLPLSPERDIMWYRIAHAAAQSSPIEASTDEDGWIDAGIEPEPDSLVDVRTVAGGFVGGERARDFYWGPEKTRLRAVLSYRLADEQPVPGIAHVEQSSGGDNDYWIADITNPKRMEPARVECEDVIQALGMTFGEGEAFKAIWRGCAARLGNGKPGDTAMRNAEKVVHYGEYMKRDAEGEE